MPDLTRLTIDPPPATTAVGERILDAAEWLFYRHGITAVGVDRIVEAAETTKRTLYQRFGSKDGLVAAYLLRRAHTWQTRLMHSLEEETPRTAVGALEVVFRTAEEWAAQNPRGCAFVNAWAELSEDEQAVEVIREEKGWMLHLFAELVGQELAPWIQLVYEGAHVTTSVLGDASAYARALEVARAVLATEGGDVQ